VEKLSAIIAIGTASPPYKRAQLELAELMSAGLNLTDPQRIKLLAINRSSGINYRYSVLKDYIATPETLEFFPTDFEKEYPSTEKRMKAYQENALPLAIESIKQCFESLDNFNKEAITHIYSAVRLDQV
jgi:predicted naringenin-chalcone synthase